MVIQLIPKNKRHMKKNDIIISLLSLTLCLICTPLRALSLYNAAIIESIVYSFITFLLLRKYVDAKYSIIRIILCIILGRIIIELPIRIVDFDKTLPTLMVTIIVILSTILTGLIYSNKKKYVIILSFISWIICAFIGHKVWFDYINFGHLSNIKITSHTIQTIEDEIKLGTIKSNYILLEFWNSSCGSCIKQFPQYQKLYDKYKNEILIRSVFVRYKDNENIFDGINCINKQECNFPIWSIDKNSSLLKELEIKVYPTIIIINHDKEIIFKGNLKEAENKMYHLLDH